MRELNKIHRIKDEPEPLSKTTATYLNLSEFGVGKTEFIKDSWSEQNETTRMEIEKENDASRLVVNRWNEFYFDILLNRPGYETPNRYAFYSLSSILLSVILTGFLTIIPVHDVLDTSSDMSQYWWETMLQAIPYFASCCAYMLLNCSYWTNITLIRTFKNYWLFFAWTLLISSVLFVGFNMCWIYGMHLRFPSPFMGLCLAYIAVNLAFIPLWLTFPKHWRREKDIRQKFRFFILSIWVNMFITLIYSNFTKAFVSVPLKYQWIAAIILVPIREFNLWLQKKVCSKAAGERNTSISLTCSHNINNRHCFFILVVLGTTATDTTCWVILAVASGVNLYLGLRILWTKFHTGFNESNRNDIIEMLIGLVINESVELIVPLAFIICFIIAYFGPNAYILGTVKSEYWHHIPVKDIYLFAGSLGIFFLAEAGTFLFSFLLLKLTCGINIMKAIALAQKEYWLLMAVNTGYTIQMVSIILKTDH